MRNKLTYKKIQKKYGETITFQSLEWDIYDFYFEETETEECVVNVFGNTEIGDSVCLSITGFKPNFYIKVPDDWKPKDKILFLETLENKLYKSSTGLDKEKCILTKRKIFYGYRGDSEDKFIQLFFNNIKTFYITRKILNNPIQIKQKTYTFAKFEDKVDFILQFIHEYSLNTIGWLNFQIKKCEMTSETKTQIEFITNINNVKKVEKTNIAPFLQMSYDIECYSDNPDVFPVPEKPENYVIQIGMTFMPYGKKYKTYEDCNQIILCLKECEKINKINTKTISFQTEKELLLHFKDIINSYDPDIIYSYNGHRFDDSYLHSRAKLLGIENDFLDMSKYKYKMGELSSKTFSSSAYGTSTRNYLNLKGRINFDLFIYINREFKLDSYSMNSVAEHFLTKKTKGIKKVEGNNIFLEKNTLDKVNIGGILTLKDNFGETNLGKIEKIYDDYIVVEKEIEEQIFPENTEIILSIQKNPVGPRDIFSFWKSGKPEKIKEIAEYCLIDTLIPLLLEQQLNIFINQIQMASVTYVPFIYLIDRGQQIKVFSQILKETKNKKFVIPNIESKKVNFEGAIVLEPKKGAYFEPIIVLDFASLYPSIMMAHNLCYSSIILEEKYKNLPGIEYKEVKWEDNGNVFNYTFAQNTDSVLPELLKNLITERKNVRKKMKTEKDPFQIMVMNGFQLALKVSANSIYGFLSAQTLQCEPIASSVTAIGREMILQTKKYADTNFSDLVETIYGDSVVGNTPIIVKNINKEVFVKNIENLANSWEPYDVFKPFEKGLNNKEQSFCDYSVWTHKGFSKIKRVIRHKTNKKIYRITTNKGVVCITQDHSLLSQNMELLKPEECRIGKTHLLHNTFKH